MASSPNHAPTGEMKNVVELEPAALGDESPQQQTTRASSQEYTREWILASTTCPPNSSASSSSSAAGATSSSPAAELLDDASAASSFAGCYEPLHHTADETSSPEHDEFVAQAASHELEPEPSPDESATDGGSDRQANGGSLPGAFLVDKERLFSQHSEEVRNPLGVVLAAPTPTPQHVLDRCCPPGGSSTTWFLTGDNFFQPLRTCAAFHTCTTYSLSPTQRTKVYEFVTEQMYVFTLGASGAASLVAGLPGMVVPFLIATEQIDAPVSGPGMLLLVSLSVSCCGAVAFTGPHLLGVATLGPILSDLSPWKAAEMFLRNVWIGSVVGVLQTTVAGKRNQITKGVLCIVGAFFLRVLVYHGWYIAPAVTLSWPQLAVFSAFCGLSALLAYNVGRVCRYYCLPCLKNAAEQQEGAVEVCGDWTQLCRSVGGVVLEGWRWVEGSVNRMWAALDEAVDGCAGGRGGTTTRTAGENKFLRRGCDW